MQTTIAEQVIEILQRTNDGEDLAPKDLKLVEMAINGWLNEAGEVAFETFDVGSVCRGPAR